MDGKIFLMRFLLVFLSLGFAFGGDYACNGDYELVGMMSTFVAIVFTMALAGSFIED